MSAAGNRPVSPSADPARPAFRSAWAVVLSWAAAALAMLAVGRVFNGLEKTIPGIQAEYQNKTVFRDWPGWTEPYMFMHPVWFGLVFAICYVTAGRRRGNAGWLPAAGSGAAFGGALFLVGSLPVFALVFAAFRVSPELVAVSWAARNLVQYVVAGGLVGLVTWALTRPEN